MRARTTKRKTDSRGKEHPPGTEISVLVASRATRGEAPCVVTRELVAGGSGDRKATRWYPGAEYAPAGAQILARLVSGKWEVAA